MGPELPLSSVSCLVAVHSGEVCLAFLMHTRKLAFEVVWQAPEEMCFMVLVLLPMRKILLFISCLLQQSVSLQHLLPIALVMLTQRQCSWRTAKGLLASQFQVGLGTGLWMSRCLNAGKLKICSNSFNLRLDILYSFPRHRNWQGLKKNHWQEVHFLYCYLPSHKTKSFFT